MPVLEAGWEADCKFCLEPYLDKNEKRPQISFDNEVPHTTKDRKIYFHGLSPDDASKKEFKNNDAWCSIKIGIGSHLETALEDFKMALNDSNIMWLPSLLNLPEVEEKFMLCRLHPSLNPEEHHDLLEAEIKAILKEEG